MIHEIDERLFPGFSHFKKIGEGAFGKVFTALNSKTNIQVAIKCVDKINLMTEANRTVFQSELAIYNKIEHPFLTQFYATTEDNAGVYIALEFGEKGTLLDRIVSQRKLKEQQSCKIFCEIVSALNYLHNTAKIIHRDIKAENIIVDNNDDIRLIDFGLSSFMNTKEEMNERCGTFVYSSPEMLRGIPYTQSIDIWSCGILLYLMVTGTFPFASEDQRELKQDICFKDPQIPTSISQDCRDLLLKLLTKEPSERITIEEIAVHPWILANRASYYPTTQFNENLKYVITPHDKSDINSLVVNSLSKNGCNISTLESDLLDGRLTESTFI
ncbi:CAMK family protein kinase [Trichomonas vaginalis G3]|uniref:CAMK family protein kinase n=1 Tax=Trichomonas vaginalis (strain ATCC PRA-98 / G3) TaxID=412133 RepID=A2FXU4_TRIV3|nr:protein serine/threonine kinase protein [Trichomonas vaginalis G3]EAX90279.1 CAMK family protein kinase [Trichomonas vaginalis G3]KAI5508642.1 protein serine/threonine kinase protein [Trichomonas vaginalis G3]|eukprot:XP_001303209.1 CAMK family protein kinase [Trichomonas vaginalis G3]